MAFIRVKDPESGNEFDLPEDHYLITEKRVDHIKPVLYPPAVRARAAKHPTELATRPGSRLPESPGEGEATKKENQNG